MPDTTPEIELHDDERTRCEVWTRVMGYHRPLSAWNAGKRSEHAERRYYRDPSTPPHGPACD
ncbi:MAG: anaerobic ribonucleoside-triphosphate reductase [Gammaproteobacteria bacterium]|nr:anaerobic ribonucleoside-triphosphate reductase [Gammaproteobacteria bacterium]